MVFFFWLWWELFHDISRFPVYILNYYVWYLFMLYPDVSISKIIARLMDTRNVSLYLIVDITRVCHIHTAVRYSLYYARTHVPIVFFWRLYLHRNMYRHKQLRFFPLVSITANPRNRHKKSLAFRKLFVTPVVHRHP